MPAPQNWMPPFPALRAFHAAARHARFRDAARELGLTESAISHQVRRLEDFLHLQLFERKGPRVSLTVSGRRYFDEIDPAISRIQDATRALLGPAERTRVSLTLPPSLATLWLIPNLADFERACPGVDLNLVTTTRICDLRREQIDLAIRYGVGSWPDVEAELLSAETSMPVCQPGYLAEAASNDVAAILTSNRLIVSAYHPEEWSEWAYAHGIAPPDVSGALVLQSQEQVLQAAERGLGIAIGRSPLVDERLSLGALEAPFGTAGPSQACYYLCYPLGAVLPVPVRRVARWLRTFAE